MTPYEIAQSVYEQEDCARSMKEDLQLHVRHGFVFITPSAFLIGRPVRKDAPHGEILSPWVQFQDPDCWLVYLAAGEGSLQTFARLEPYPLPWFAWERDNRLRFYERSRLMRRIWHSTEKSSV